MPLGLYPPGHVGGEKFLGFRDLFPERAPPGGHVPSHGVRGFDPRVVLQELGRFGFDPEEVEFDVRWQVLGYRIRTLACLVNRPLFDGIPPMGKPAAGD